MKIKEIAKALGLEFRGDGEIEITSVASIDEARENELTFSEHPKVEARSKGASVIARGDAQNDFAATLISENPKLDFARAALLIIDSPLFSPEVHSTAVIGPDCSLDGVSVAAFATVGEGTVIGNGTRILEGVRIGSRVRIGSNCVIHPNTVIYDNVSIGDNGIIHAGAVIGADGFGFVRNGSAGWVKFPQIGIVLIGDDVEIGAGTCIDRGALGVTRIGNGTKIDNLVQIAHNVSIGERVVIASQTGISGSTVIESDCVIGGQVGFGDHATVKSGAVIGSQAGVLPGKIVRPGVWWGTPVQPLDEYKRQNALVKGIGRLRDDVRELKRKLGE